MLFPLVSLLQYCTRLSLDEGSLKFLFDGQRVRGTQTPSELDMEDGDVIEVSCARCLLLKEHDE